MNQDEHKIVVRRMAGLIAAASVLIAVYVLRLIFLQLVNSDSFKAQATNTTDYNFTVTAARGDIVDSAGRRIAASTTSYNVVLSKLLMGDEDLDAMLQRIVELLEAHGEKWNDSLLIGEPDAAGHYSFTAQADSTSDQKALAAMKDSLGLQQYATADDVMEKLVEDYKLESYPLHWQRVLGGIHYEMQQQAFSNVNNFVMAENVSEVTVATIKENSLTMPGVEIVETSTRSYDEGDIIPHVLGRVGKITAEKWKVTDENGQTTYPLREKGYNMNDMIGVSGLEAVYEDELRGKDGVETITRSSDGVIVGTAMTTVPEPGHTVQLTIDSAFQQAVDKALAKNIEMINSTYNSGSSAKAAAGAVVVISTKDGSVLAASNYPSYDQNLFATQYSQYSSDPGLPLLNRALQGLYTPGSTFKPAVAVAALDSGVINRFSTVYCNGVYTYYDDYRPKCTRHGHSGNIDVITAIKWSCNIFFYDVGRRTTSDVYDAYAYKMGLGTRTGVEVNEATGRLTTKNDSNYTASLDIQAAIGQGNTVVTPVQLATYAGTLANRGVRYRTHFVKAILDTNTGKVLQETQPEVMDVIEDRGDTFDLVRQGMIGVSETVSGLKNYPVTIACKTGTPQRSETYYVGSTRKHYTNTMMVAYGPAEDAEIALGIVIEYGGGGARAGNLVADIFDAYYAMKDGSLTFVKDKPNGLKDFMKVLIPKQASTLQNVQGNHCGSWNFALSYYLKDWKFRAYLEHYFEDHSQMFWQYGRWKDGHLGLEVTLPENRWVTRVLWEGLNTKDQTGPILYDGIAGSFQDVQMSGGDNYYTNGEYLGWQHAGLGLGHPFLPGPAYNTDGSNMFKSNRVRANHLGMTGDPSEEWNWRVLVSFARHWGTYSAPLDKPRKQFGSLWEVTYRPKRLAGWSFSAALGLDRGNYLPGNTAGGTFCIRKTGELLKR